MRRSKSEVWGNESNHASYMCICIIVYMYICIYVYMYNYYIYVYIYIYIFITSQKWGKTLTRFSASNSRSD